MSQQARPYWSGNDADYAHTWSALLSFNARMGRILGPERYCALRFEDLVGDSEKSLRRLCEFLGVAFEGALLNYGAMVEEKIPHDRRWLWPSLNKPPQVSKLALWRPAMTRSHREDERRGGKACV